MKNLFLSFLLIGTLHLQGQVLPLLDFVEITTGLTQPVGITHAGDERLFIVEQPGRIQIVDTSGQVLGVPFLDITQRVRDARNEQGLLGLAFHPDYGTNGYFYVNYIDNSGNTQVSRFSKDVNDPNLADPNSELKIIDVNQPFTNHNGGQIAFGPDGYLYIGMGDGGSGGDPQNNAQNPLSLLGKMLRIDVNTPTGYDIPPDNPYTGLSSKRNEIWALGLRNPWRFSFDPLNGDLWIGDVGQDDEEEITRQPGGSLGGENYGWRCLEGNSFYNANGCGAAGDYDGPTFAYNHPRFVDQSITGGYVYRGQDHPGMYGYYIFADYETGDFWLTKSDSLMGFPTQKITSLSFGRGATTFGTDNRGELYVANRFSGKIFQIVDKRTSLTGENLSEIAQISPNPFADFFQIQFKSPQPAVEVQIWDLSGKLIYAEKGRNVREMKIEGNTFTTGVYVVEIKTSEKSFRGKIIAR
jgi:glucose/arabinose dehydrogenase